LRKLKPDITLGYAIKPMIYGTFAAWLSGDAPISQRLLSSARVVVVSLFHGAVIKIKILEAIGLGKLVVANSNAIIGASLGAGQYFLIADDPEMLAALCVSVLQEQTAFQYIKTRGQNLFQNQSPYGCCGKENSFRLSSFDKSCGESTCVE
jgi:hypothetical protein